ncbi:hypothetical protein CNR22_17085 [Sphingobacteriaceae bacterium]|nr:hypothetical protein CNR22_17085 [Sphingobacteriaceae bacterium]
MTNYLFAKSWQFFLLLFIFSGFLHGQSITTTTVSGTSPYCAGTSVNVTYTISGTFSNTPSNNVFTAELSDINGSFASPVTIGTRTATNGGVIASVIPFTTASSILYRIRVKSSNPAIFGSDNGYNLTINAPTISTPTVSALQICQNDGFTVAFSKTCNFGAGNVFSFQLSNASGSFASPATLATYTNVNAGTYNITMPTSVAAGSAYRIRVVSSNPVITSADNGSDIVVSAAAGNPTVAGTGGWNAYCFNAFNNYTLNYQGFYTETAMNINTQNMWVNANSPSSATSNGFGTGYAGCPFGNQNYSISYLRTNFTCGYYQIDIPGHDDNIYLYVNGSLIYQHAGCCDAHTNVWTGFIGPSTTVECRFTNGGGPGYMSVNFVPVNPLTVSPPPTICSGTSSSLTVSNSNGLPLTYSWSPAASLNSPTGSMVVASPTITTTYTVAGIDGTTGCPVTTTLLVTVNPVPTTTMVATPTLICTGVSTATMIAGGANTYSWSPSAGLNTTTGNSVIANPTITTSYTVSGSNNCSVVTVVRTISVQTPPVSPATTVFGNGTWNAYCHSNATLNSYFGYYTENNLSFDSQVRWNSNNGPSTCTNTSTGLAYSGCTFPGNPWSISYKRTNIPCGYYQINIPGHDDGVYLYINGVQVYQHNGCCDAHTAVWTGFIGPATTVEFQIVNTGGPGYLAVTFLTIPYPVLGPPVTICAGTSATLTADMIAGAGYSWTPSASVASPANYTTAASPTITTNYTCTITDAITSCSASANVLITVSPTTAVSVSPVTSTANCSANVYTLTATGANTYSWLPTAGLSSATGYTVVASPSVTTVYTVTGNNNCVTSSATATVVVLPLISPTVFPTTAWNAYCYGDVSQSSYYGYYTENGVGASGYNFSTATRFSSTTPIPSNANATNGLAYSGCSLTASNWSISFKRRGFTCGTYSINVFHDDYFYLFVNGVQVAQHTNGINDTHNGVWTGVLNPSSTVEFILVQTTGNGVLSVTLAAIAIPAAQSTWIGTTSSDWFTSSNWCGNGVPTATLNVVIPGSGPQFMPVISAAGAQCRNINVGSPVNAGTYNSALPAASLGISGAFALDVYGDWINGGIFSTGSGSINILGSIASTFSCASTTTETIYNLTVNKTGTVGITMNGGMHSISNSLVLTNGRINQTSSLTILNGATATGQSNASYVNGPIAKIGTNAFTFPVGTGGSYRPISISSPTASTDYFVAQYFYGDPNGLYSASLRDASLDHVGRCEYWILNRALGVTSNVSVTMTWDPNSCAINNLPDLRVARWDAGQVKWKDQGNGGTTGTNSAGSLITSGPVPNFSPFNFGSATAFNPLPISLKTFYCSMRDRTHVDLVWVTSSEHNNDFFDVESSYDGLTFKTLGRLKGAGESRREVTYNYTDLRTGNATVYYRLKQVNFDNTFSYSSICYAGENSDPSIKVYPNPVTDRLSVEFNPLLGTPQNVHLLSALGAEMPFGISNSDGTMILTTSELTTGIYFLEFILQDKKTVFKVNVLK